MKTKFWMEDILINKNTYLSLCQANHLIQISIMRFGIYYSINHML